MKSHQFFHEVFFYLVICVFFPLFSMSQWTWKNPLPQGNSLYGVQFVNHDTGFAVGDGGTILKTVDRGITWTRLNTGVLHDFKAVFFLTPDIGYVVGGIFPEWKNSGVLLKTTDGGQTWTTLGLDTFISCQLLSVFFTDPLNGYVGGYNFAYKTADGGITWHQLITPYDDYHAIFFTDSQTGYLGGASYLSKTTDAGNTWNMQIFNSHTGSIIFVDPQTGFATGGPGIVYKTTNAGLYWEAKYTGLTYGLTSLFFLDSLTGFGTGYLGSIVKTSDAGNTWTLVSSGTSRQYNSICFPNTDTGIAIGAYGSTIMTTDQGNTWNMHSSNISLDTLYSMHFPTQETGYVCGSSGGIFKTSDAGETWTLLPTGTNKKFLSIFFTDVNHGFAAGEWGTILKTENGGLTWAYVSSGTVESLFSIFFPSANVGYVLDGYYNILKTTNSGNLWTNLFHFDFMPGSLYFTSIDTGYVSGENGHISKTTDGGISWIPLNSGYTSNCGPIIFPESSIGYVVGGPGILKTTNSGTTWSVKYSGTVGILSVYFSDIQNGHALGYDLNDNFIILKTTDGGETWVERTLDFSNYWLNQIYFTDPDTGFIVGENGLIMKTTTGGVITSYNLHDDNAWVRIYPNPSSEKIHFNLDKPVKVLDVQMINLTGIVAYDKKFFNVGGMITLDVSGLPHGMYVMKIATNENSKISKVIIN